MAYDECMGVWRLQKYSTGGWSPACAASPQSHSLQKPDVVVLWPACPSVDLRRVMRAAGAPAAAAGALHRPFPLSPWRLPTPVHRTRIR